MRCSALPSRLVFRCMPRCTARQARRFGACRLPAPSGAHASPSGLHRWAAVLYTAGGLALYGAAAAQSPAHADAEPLSKLTAVRERCSTPGQRGKCRLLARALAQLVMSVRFSRAMQATLTACRPSLRRHDETMPSQGEQLVISLLHISAIEYAVRNCRDACRWALLRRLQTRLADRSHRRRTATRGRRCCAACRRR